MSSEITHDAAHDGAHDEHDHHGPAKGLMRWITTTNHKDIGTLYLWLSFIMLLYGGSMAMITRFEERSLESTELLAGKQDLRRVVGAGCRTILEF